MFQSALLGAAFLISAWNTYDLNHHFLTDEPDRNKMLPAKLRAAYNANKSAHPNRVEIVNFADCTQVHRYIGDFDQFTADSYPFYVGSSTSDALAEWDMAVKACVRVARRFHLPMPMMIAQAFRGSVPNVTPWRCPTRYEVKRMISDTRKLGASGILFYWEATLIRRCLRLRFL